MIRQFVFILFAICLVRKAFAAPACMTLQASPQERLINPCAGVVDYAFYVPSGVSLDYLRKKASAKLNSTQLLALSGVCQGAIVRYACSLIYLKCQPNIVLTNPATYNFNIYNGSSRPIPLPIQRPCVSVCTSLSTACAEPLAALAGFSSNCYAKYDYANNKSLAMPYRFDLSNSATQCYSPRMIPLSGPKEKYIRGNTPCNGVVDEFFVLPGPRLNPNYTVLQLPNTIQTVINTGLNQAMSHFPKWLTPECNTAIRQYFCYQVFFRAQGVSVKQALLEGIAGTMYQNSFPQLQAVANNLYPGLLNSPVYFPRYANRSLCYNYERVCMDFRIRAEMPALEPNCERTTGGFELFPNAKNQTVLTSSFPVTMGANKVMLTLKFETEPDYSGYHNTTEMGYEVRCPPNFVTNPDPDNEDITTVHGTGCAAACRTAFWTPSEWSSFDDFGIVISAISVAFCVMVITAIVVTNDWKASFLVFCFTITSLASSIYHLAITAGMPWEQRFCASDALRRRRSAGPSDCIRHSIMSSFLYLVGCIVIFLMAMQRALELSGNQAVLAKPGYNFFQFIIALVPPLLAVGLAWARSYFGFAGATPWCSMDLMPSVYLMGFPTLVICGFTYIVYLYSSARYLRSSQHARVAVSNTSYSLLSANASGASTGKTMGATATPAKAMTVISIGANVDSSPVRAFDDDDDHPAHHHHSSDPLFTRQHQDAEAGAASSNVTGVVLTEVSPASDIEMKQIAAGAHVPSIEAAQMNGPTIKPIINETALHTMRMNIILSACIFGSICIHIGWVILKFGNYFFGTPYYNSMVSYTQCVFRNWDTQTTESYTRVCGMHPHFRPTHSAMNFYILCLFGNMVVMGPMYLMASAFAYWYTKRLTAAASASARTSVATVSTVSTVSIATP